VGSTQEKKFFFLLWTFQEFCATALSCSANAAMWSGLCVSVKIIGCGVDSFHKTQLASVLVLIVSIIGCGVDSFHKTQLASVFVFIVTIIGCVRFSIIVLQHERNSLTL
jgi:hypothetical protein